MIQPQPKLKVKKCCGQFEDWIYVVYNSVTMGTVISISFGDHEYDIDGVFFCHYCGKRLEIEEEDPTAKNKALEDLKEQMEKAHATRRIKQTMKKRHGRNKAQV